MSGGDSTQKSQIKEVWAENLEEEMAVMRELVDRYPYLSMDTEFPGVVARPVGNFRSQADYQYQTLRCNVDLLKIIQLGLTFSDEQGNMPPGTCTWQFNFNFNLNDDMFAQDSIDLLHKSGLDFTKHATHGIDIQHFGELLISSGFVLMEHVKWIAFHGTYDFGYLLKVVTCEPLPDEEPQFHELLHQYFPCIYDIKYLMKSCKNLRGGLQEVADNLAVERVGPQHQAGSDSLLTAVTFFKMRKTFFEDNIDDSKYLGQLYGLGTSYAGQFHSNTNGISKSSSTSVTPSTTPVPTPSTTPQPLTTFTPSWKRDNLSFGNGALYSTNNSSTGSINNWGPSVGNAEDGVYNLQS